MALKLNPLLVNTDAVKAGRLPVFQRQASTSRGSHFEKTPKPWEVGYESLHTTIFFESVNYKCKRDNPWRKRVRARNKHWINKMVHFHLFFNRFWEFPTQTYLAAHYTVYTGGYMIRSVGGREGGAESSRSWTFESAGETLQPDVRLEVLCRLTK